MTPYYILQCMKFSPWANIHYDMRFRPCRKCGRDVAIQREPTDATLEKGSSLTDAIGSGSGGFLVSKAVTDLLLKTSECPVKAVPLRLNSRLASLHPKGLDYFMLRPNLSVDVRPYTRTTSVESCSECGCLLRATVPYRYEVITRPSEDKMIYQMGGFTNLNILCTSEFVAIARQKRWSNLLFRPLEWTLDEAQAKIGVDYLGREWPPRTIGE